MLEIRGFTDSALAGVESELDCLEYEDIIYIKLGCGERCV